MQKIISVDFKGDFGFFRKPDANNTINLSYNMLHKPALLGILGAIVGLEGYKEKGVLPQYYLKFKNLKISIEPLEHENGNFQKTVIKYTNTIGYANDGNNFVTEEATLIKPSYRVYFLLDLALQEELQLYDCLKEGKAEFIPYFGKNEFYAYWQKESFTEYSFELVEKTEQPFRISSLFILKEDSTPAIEFQQEESVRNRSAVDQRPFLYFERLPNSFDETLFQYQLDKFAFSNYLFKETLQLSNLYKLNTQKYIQLY